MQIGRWLKKDQHGSRGYQIGCAILPPVWSSDHLSHDRPTPWRDRRSDALLWLPKGTGEAASVSRPRRTPAHPRAWSAPTGTEGTVTRRTKWGDGAARLTRQGLPLAGNSVRYCLRWRGGVVRGGAKRFRPTRNLSDEMTSVLTSVPMTSPLTGQPVEVRTRDARMAAKSQ